MPSISLKKDQQFIVAPTGSTEQLLKFEVTGICADSVTLDFSTGGKVAVHGLEDWERLQSNGDSPKPKPVAPKRAPYMD
jgi:hypothetical protein